MNTKKIRYLDLILVAFYASVSIGVFYIAINNYSLFIFAWKEYRAIGVLLGVILALIYHVKSEAATLSNSASESKKTIQFQNRIQGNIAPMLFKYIATIIVMALFIVIFGIYTNFDNTINFIEIFIGSLILSACVFIVFKAIHIYYLLSTDISKLSILITQEKLKEKKRNEQVNRLREERKNNPLKIDNHLSGYNNEFFSIKKT